MKHLILAAGLLALPVAASAQDWTGGYGGLSYGGSDIDATGGLSGDGESVGLFGGYNWDTGDVVYGVEADWDSTDYSIGGGAVNVTHTARLKGRIGVDMGAGLGYATAGFVRANTDALGNDNGYLFGIGYDYNIGKNTLLGAEVLQHEFDDFNGSGTDVSVTTFKARLGFKF